MGLSAHKAYNSAWCCTSSKNSLRPLMQYILYDCSDTPSYQRKSGLFFKPGSIVVGFFVLLLFLNFQSAFEIYMQAQNNRELKQARQRRRQLQREKKKKKTVGLMTTALNGVHFAFLVHFFGVHCTTSTRILLIRFYGGLVKKSSLCNFHGGREHTTTIFLSLFEAG